MVLICIMYIYFMYYDICLLPDLGAPFGFERRA